MTICYPTILADAEVDYRAACEVQSAELDIKVDLDELAELLAQKDTLRLEQQALVDSVLTPEIRKQIADIECEFAPKLAELAERTARVEGDVKAGVVLLGQSVKGRRLHAVFNHGRVSWNTRGLDGYLLAHPELAMFRNEGEPSVSIRKF